MQDHTLNIRKMTLPIWLNEKADEVIINVHAQPGAKRSAIVGLYGDKLKIAIATPPVDGKANKALIAYIAKTLEIPKSKINIISGESSREKRIRIQDITANECVDKLK